MKPATQPVTQEPKLAHTPGPWTFSVHQDTERVKLAEKFGLEIGAPTQCELHTVAHTQHTAKLKGPIYLGVVYEEANARLISAAPELLEALKEAKELIRFFHGDPAWEIYDSSSPEMKRLNAAIAKATGAEGTRP